jgi:hypothetical protein
MVAREFKAADRCCNTVDFPPEPARQSRKSLNMVAIKTRFDGETIITPAEIRGAPPGEVIIIVQEATGAGQRRTSIFDFIGKAANPRSAEDIDAQVRQERESWGDR